MTDVVLAYDEGPGVGLGHRRRVEAVASALGELGVSSRLCQAGTAVRADVAVVDSYRFRADDTDVFDAPVVVAIDDLERELAVDVVVDPCPRPAAADAHGTTVLAGFEYAPLDPALSTRRPVDRAGDRVDRVLVVTGGSDAGGRGMEIAARLRDELPDEVQVRAVLGPWSTGAPAAGVDVVRDLPSLAGELAAADVVVTAAGVTLLESLCLGRPTVSFVLFDNQRRQATALARAGAAVVCDPDDAVTQAVRLAADDDARTRLAEAGPKLVDGDGARRIAAEVLGRA